MTIKPKPTLKAKPVVMLLKSDEPGVYVGRGKIALYVEEVRNLVLNNDVWVWFKDPVTRANCYRRFGTAGTT